MTAFTDLPLHPALARALQQKDYETATPVQAAVMAAELVGRDLLVSSQTGSGKTVAFGSVVAQTLLAGEEPFKAKAGAAPLALIVAPTRELAAQVHRELTWLFHGTGLRIGAFTGGTDVGRDARNLRTGVDMVVGTPGRLVDLLSRKALDLSAVQVVVLDEADEMLDMGFRDDLEALLQEAPTERRTLMFSATLPREIQTLAKKYQRDAVRVDTAAGSGPARAHTDITFVAHLIPIDDRLAAVVNILLAGGDARAIVFCRTRDGVGRLHQRLLDHGFKAAAISGERAQGERDRALEALRSGKVPILVATNVAARGLDLPDVEMVLHADLPENADALTHRSGRTGRAGRKGTSIILADIAERRKAERLMMSARIPFEWTGVPTPAVIRQAQLDVLWNEVLASATDPSQALPPTDPMVEQLADRLRATWPDRALVGLMLAREMARMPRGLPVASVDLQKAKQSRMPLAEGPRADFRDSVMFRVNLGRGAKAEAGWLLPLICRRGGVTRREVGAIRVGAEESTFEIAGEAAEEFALAAGKPDPRAPQVAIERVLGHGAAPRSRPGERAISSPYREAAPRARAPHPAPRRASPAAEAVRPRPEARSVEIEKTEPPAAPPREPGESPVNKPRPVPVPPAGTTEKVSRLPGPKPLSKATPASRPRPHAAMERPANDRSPRGPSLSGHRPPARLPSAASRPPLIGGHAPGRPVQAPAGPRSAAPRGGDRPLARPAPARKPALAPWAPPKRPDQPAPRSSPGGFSPSAPAKRRPPLPPKKR